MPNAINQVGGRLSPSDTDLLDLAPVKLSNYWKGRFTAENERRHLNHFAPRDQTLLNEVYGTLQELFENLKGHHLELDRLQNIIGAFVDEGRVRSVLRAMNEFGAATIAAGNVPGIDRNIHDLRGGAFQALSFRLELFDPLASAIGLQSIYFLLRDHLKIMRNSVCDLDAERFAADHSKLDHDVHLLVEKWSEAEFAGAACPVEVKLDCRFTGTLCESCLEFSTLDRIIYNFMNNAAKYSSDAKVNFYILALPEPTPASIRFVFCNTVDESHREKLKQKFSDKLGEIFRGGFTTGGHGLGMRICADFCAQAFGISDFEKAMNSGYFGAKWIDDKFATWFHWPIAHGIT